MSLSLLPSEFGTWGGSGIGIGIGFGLGATRAVRGRGCGFCGCGLGFGGGRCGGWEEEDALEEEDGASE